MSIQKINQKRPVGSKLTMCKENFLSVHGVFLTTKNFYGLKRMNLELENFKSSGIIQHVIEQKLTFKSLKHLKPTPKALTFHQLKGTFQILFPGLLLACFVFLVELVKA